MHRPALFLAIVVFYLPVASDSRAETPADFRPVRVSLWGTSSFHGGGNPDPLQTFCGQLQRRIYPHIVANLSVGGATIPFYEKERTVDAILSMQPDTVLIMQGSNDIGGGRSVAEITTDLRTHGERFRKAGIRTVYSTWQPRKDFDDKKSLSLFQLNQWLRNRFHAPGLLLDIPPTLSAADDPAIMDPRYDSGDGVHFGDAGNRTWAERISLATLADFPPIRDAFNRPSGAFVQESAARREGAWSKAEGKGYLGGNALLSERIGDSVTFSYTGRNFCVWSKRRKDFGVVEVLLDGTRLAAVDCYGIHWPKHDGYRAMPIYASAHVEPGTHSVTLRVTGQKNPISKGTFVSADAIEYQP